MWTFKSLQLQKLQKCKLTKLWYNKTKEKKTEITTTTKNIKTLKFLTYVNTPALLPTLMWPYTDSPSHRKFCSSWMLHVILFMAPATCCCNFFVLLKVNFLTVEEVKTKVLRTFFSPALWNSLDTWYCQCEHRQTEYVLRD